MGKKLFIGFFVVTLAVYSLSIFTSAHTQRSKKDSQAQTQVSQTAQSVKSISYKGEEGKNALQLLQEKMTIKQDSSGLVVAINNREAIKTKREYWAFYVNGKLSSVGPNDYFTKDTDQIEWRIETY